MKSKNILILITLFFCFCLNVSYSNDYDERALLAQLPYDIGDEDSVRDWEILKPYIEESVDNNRRIYFKNRYEVQYAQQFNYISVETGEILYKSKKCQPKKQHCCAGM